MPCLVWGAVLCKGMRRTVLGIGLVAAGLIGAAGALHLWGEPGGLSLSGPPAPRPESRPDMTFLGARVVEDRAGERLWEVAADRAVVFKGAGRAVLTREKEPVRITLYSDGRRLEATAERAVIWMERREVLLEGSVLARSDQGITLRTDWVTWSADRRSLETDAPVTLERAGLTVEGEGMEADLTLERMMLKVHRGSRLTGQGKGQS